MKHYLDDFSILQLSLNVNENICVDKKSKKLQLVGGCCYFNELVERILFSAWQQLIAFFAVHIKWGRRIYWTFNLVYLKTSLFNDGQIHFSSSFIYHQCNHRHYCLSKWIFNRMVSGNLKLY